MALKVLRCIEAGGCQETCSEPGCLSQCDHDTRLLVQGCGYQECYDCYRCGRCPCPCHDHQAMIEMRGALHQLWDRRMLGKINE